MTEKLKIRSLGKLPLNVHKLRESRNGRSLLIAAGKWTDKQVAKRQEKTRRRNQRNSRPYSAPFMGWDGEGMDIGDRHQYIMLCNSTGATILNRRGLTTEDCLKFITDQARMHPFFNHVMFGGSYDANKILCDLSYWQLRRLAQRGWLVWGTYHIKYRPRKFLTIAKLGTPKKLHRDGKWRYNREVSITIWDVLGFFQTSFVKAVKGWLPEQTPTRMAFVEEMKGARSTFTRMTVDEIRHYCVIECELLVTLMEQLREHAKAVGYCPSRWDGAGAMSTAMLQKHKIKQYMSKTDTVHEEAKYGYFGGRIEMVRYGHACNRTYAHDIRSAYPAAMLQLPCLKHGHWRKGNGNYFLPEYPFSIYHIDFTASDTAPFYPLPWRSRHRMVFFPPSTIGWYWHPEVKNLLRYWPESFKILQSWHWIRDCDHVPFSFNRDVYEYRLALKRAGNPANIAIKLPLNGEYGKLAQQVGGKDGKPPPFHQLEWAGYITSVTRARMYDLAMRHPEAVIAFETDGLYGSENFLIPVNGVGYKESEELGAWELTEYEDLIYVQSGVYFVLTKDGWKAKYRGLNPGTITEEDVLNAWEKGRAEIEAFATRFRGMMTSTISMERFTTFGQWREEPKTIALTPQGKRLSINGINSVARNPAYELITTMPTGGGKHSEPHQLAWENPLVRTMDDPYYAADMFYEEDEDY